MNIFTLSFNQRTAAQAHCDKHVVKMILEYGLLLSTAHRLIDGTLSTFEKPNGKLQKLYLLKGETVSFNIEKAKFIIDNPVCYGVTHFNHPCAVWARESSANYMWLSMLFMELSQEYTHRYTRTHKTQATIGHFLSGLPHKIKMADLTPHPQVMPDEFKDEDPVRAYQNYYLGPKAAFARWTNRSTPIWFQQRFKDYNASNFERTTTVA
jgi:hypothetical protein